MTALIPTNDHFAPVRALVLDTVSPASRAIYGRALNDFEAHRQRLGAPPFTRSLVMQHRAHLEAQGLAASTINLRLAAIRKLAQEAAANGLLDFETAVSIRQVPGVRQRGTRTGNWLSKQGAQRLLDAPPAYTLKGKRDRAILALLVLCGLRRSEVVALTVEHIQQREGHWLIIDLMGKGGRIRTVPLPAEIKPRLEEWLAAAGITTGLVFRAIDRHGRLGASLSRQAVLDLVAESNAGIRPHDLRRTCAKLCHRNGGDLAQIQLLLGHASISTTERYLGVQQDLEHAPNDHLGFAW